MPWTPGKKTLAVLLLVASIGLASLLARSRAEADRTEDAGKLARNMAQSRLNLRRLVLAMHAYADANRGMMPPPAIVNKEGKATLSWRVLLLPYLGEKDLYEQFKPSEPWDSPHNKKLLRKMPAVYAAPGLTASQPHSTFYQVFVTPKRIAAGGNFPASAFIEGQQLRFPASFTDGLANTILIVEAGKAVAWSKPEDLPFTPDKVVPELGGIFPKVTQVAFANGDVRLFVKNPDEMNLRYAITSSGGEVLILDLLEKLPAEAEERRKNRELRENLEETMTHLSLLREERELLTKRAAAKTPSDARTSVDEMRKENARLQQQLEKAKEEREDLQNEIRERLKKPAEKSSK